MTSDLSLFYYYRKRPGDLRTVSRVEVSSEADVDHCKRLILQKVGSQGSVTDADLYALPFEHSVPVDAALDVTLGNLSMSDLGEPLSPFQSLQNVFGDKPERNRLHLVMVDRGIPLRVTFWIPSLGQIFDTKVEQGDTPHILLGEMKERFMVLGDNLAVFKTSYKKPGDVRLIAAGGQPLAESGDLFTAFDDLTFAEFPCVRVDFQEQKHQTWDPAERATKRQKLEKEKHSSLHASSTERLLGYHQPVDHPDEFLEKDLPPIEVLFDGFGKFLDVWRAAYTSNDGAEPPTFREKIAIDYFVDTMCKDHPDDSSRCWKALDNLDDIFARTVRGTIMPSTTASPSIGGHSICMTFHSLPCIVVVCGNEGAGSTGTPAVELAGYYSRIVGEIAKHSPEAVRRSRLPALGITIVGSTVTFFGLAHVGSVVYVPLTTSFWCLPVECGGSDRRQLYAAFNAAFVLLTSIEEEARRHREYHSPPIERPFYPQINRLAGYPDSNTSVDLQITGFVLKDLSRHIYTASSSSGKLVVKLTRSYSAELHAFCADLGHAPKLLAFEKLPGGIFAVAMECLVGETLGVVWSTVCDERRAEWVRELHGMVDKMHEAGYVHGDLRTPNIWRVNDRMTLLDFDWGGKIGEACYPTPYLHPQLTKGRNMSSLKITKEDDDRVLKDALGTIKDSANSDSEL